MKASSFRGVSALLIMAILILPSPAQSGETGAGLSEATKGGIGCLAVSAVVMSASLWAGPSELIMIAAGGLLVPSGATPLLVSLTATLIAASCGVGFAATPAALWLTEQAGVIFGNDTRGSPGTTEAYSRPKAVLVADGRRQKKLGADTLTAQPPL